MTTREAWYQYYRLVRIARRRATKVVLESLPDLLIYGTSVITLDSKGNLTHIPYEDL